MKMALTISTMHSICHSTDQDNLIDLICLHAGIVECFLARVEGVPNDGGSKGLKLGVHELLIDMLRSTGTR
jgi:hypothetical protein